MPRFPACSMLGDARHERGPRGRRRGATHDRDRLDGDPATCAAGTARDPPAPPRPDQARDRVARWEHRRRADQDEGPRWSPRTPTCASSAWSTPARLNDPRSPAPTAAASSSRRARRMAGAPRSSLCSPSRCCAGTGRASASCGAPGCRGRETATVRRGDRRPVRRLATENRLWDAERIRGEVAQARHPREHAHGLAAHARRSPAAPRRPDLGDLPAEPRPRDLGLRLPPGHGSALPPTPCVRRGRARVAPRGLCRRHATSHGCPGRPTAARGHAVRPAATTPHPRPRQQVRAGLRAVLAGYSIWPVTLAISRSKCQSAAADRQTSQHKAPPVGTWRRIIAPPRRILPVASPRSHHPTSPRAARITQVAGTGPRGARRLARRIALPNTTGWR